VCDRRERVGSFRNWVRQKKGKGVPRQERKKDGRGKFANQWKKGPRLSFNEAGGGEYSLTRKRQEGGNFFPEEGGGGFFNKGWQNNRVGKVFPIMRRFVF